MNCVCNKFHFSHSDLCHACFSVSGCGGICPKCLRQMALDMYAVALITWNLELDKTNPLLLGVCPIRLQRAFNEINIALDIETYTIKL